MNAQRPKRTEGGKGVRRAPARPAALGQQVTGEETHLAWGRKNYLLLGLGGIGLVVGFLLLSAGETALAPVLLVGSYLGLIPWGIVASPSKSISSREASGPVPPKSGE
jgi:hypothetical protein